MLKHFRLSGQIVILLYVMLIPPSLCEAQAPEMSKQEIDRQYDLFNDKAYNDQDFKELQQLLESSKALGYKAGILRGSLMLVDEYIERGDYQNASSLNKESEQLARELKDSSQFSKLYLYKSYIYSRLGIEKECIDAAWKAAQATQLIKGADERHYQLSIAYQNIAAIFASLHKPQDSVLLYVQKSLHEAELISGDTAWHTRKYNMILLQCVSTGGFYAGISDPPRLDLAEPYYLKALAYRQTHPQVFRQSELRVLNSAGQFYLAKGDYKKAIQYATEALELEKQKNRPYQRLRSYNVLVIAYENLNDSAQYIKYLGLYTFEGEKVDSATNRNIDKVTQQLVAEKEEEQQVLHRSNIKDILLIAGFVILLVSAGIWVYWKRNNRRLHHNYEQLITKLNAEKEIAAIVPEADAEAAREAGTAQQGHETLMEAVAEEDSNETADTTAEEELAGEPVKEIAPVNIADETMAILMTKLGKFEKSGKYLKKDISLTSLAHQLSTNPKYLSEAIRQHSDKTFSSYINGLKIDYITRKLYSDPLYREYKISHLAEDCGFASRQVFVLAFKKETGVTPSYFINQLKTGVA